MKHLLLIIISCIVALTSCQKTDFDWKKNINTEVNDVVIMYPETLNLKADGGWQEIKISTVPDTAEYFLGYNQSDFSAYGVKLDDNENYFAPRTGELTVKVCSNYSGKTPVSVTLYAISNITKINIIGKVTINLIPNE